MEIRELPPDLTDDAVAIWHAVGLTRPWNDPVSDLRRALDGSSSTVLAALIDGKLAGTVMVGHDGHRGWLYYLAVDVARRRAGIGSALVRAAEARLEECPWPCSVSSSTVLGCDRMALAAQAMLERVGGGSWRRRRP